MDKQKNPDFSSVVTVGIVGHCPIDNLAEVKHALESLSCFRIVYLKTTSGKLWIKEGDENR